MRTSESTCVLPFIEVRIFRAQNSPTSGLVNFVVNLAVAQIGSSQQTWYVRIIHDASISQTVYLKGIDFLALAVSRVGVVFDSFLNLRLQAFGICNDAVTIG